jgi:hypothetical protein
MAKFNWSSTYDRDTASMTAYFTEAMAGLAYRPAYFDILNTIAEYSYIEDLTPAGQQNSESTIPEIAHVLSVEGILDPGFNLQLGEKYAMRRSIIQDPGVGTWTENDLYLWVNRLNYHLTYLLDASVEYRILWDMQAMDNRNGFLAALYYSIGKNMRLGVGYNFTTYTDNLTFLNYNAKGPFINAVGKW